MSHYQRATRLFAIVVGALGLAMVVSTILRGGGPFSLGVIVGVAFALLGAGRYYLAVQR
jgi:hypothetical protein